MLIPKVYLSKDISNDELYKLVEDGLGMNMIKEVRKDLNNVELITEWSRFELKLEGRELSINQKWAKSKTPTMIIMGIATLLLWFPALIIFYLVYRERKLSKEILNQVGARINNS